MERLGEKIRWLRKQHGYTLMQLAAKLDMKSYSHLAEIETGKSKPSLELLVKISQLFNVTPNQLLLDDININD